MKTHLSVRAWMLFLLDPKQVVPKILQRRQPSVGVSGLSLASKPYMITLHPRCIDTAAGYLRPAFLCWTEKYECCVDV